MSDNPRIAPIEKATDRSWAEWMKFMDQIGAKDLDHKTIAGRVNQELVDKVDNPGWWAQGITVAYEQEIGRRLPGQRADGSFEVSLSRATDMSMTELMKAWTAFALKDEAVVHLVDGQVRSSGTDKRLYWKAKIKDGSAVIVVSQLEVGGQASLIVQLAKLADRQASQQAKAEWLTIVEQFLAKVRM